MQCLLFLRRINGALLRMGFRFRLVPQQMMCLILRYHDHFISAHAVILRDLHLFDSRNIRSKCGDQCFCSPPQFHLSVGRSPHVLFHMV